MENLEKIFMRFEKKTLQSIKKIEKVQAIGRKNSRAIQIKKPKIGIKQFQLGYVGNIHLTLLN